MNFIKILNDSVKQGKFIEKFTIKEHNTMKVYKVVNFELYYMDANRNTKLIFSRDLVDRIPEDKKDEYKDKLRMQYLSGILVNYFNEHGI